MNIWKPIETAPLDTLILVWAKATDRDGADFNIWPAIIVEDDWSDDRCVSVAVASFGDTISEKIGFCVGCAPATHWMPLPGPPE